MDQKLTVTRYRGRNKHTGKQHKTTKMKWIKPKAGLQTERMQPLEITGMKIDGSWKIC